ncbi:hypothetical protein KR018_011621 [Drosophila ironensis]|nr:hypothetical protein KR018_011621 [Drosophila ironensis]
MSEVKSEQMEFNAGPSTSNELQQQQQQQQQQQAEATEQQQVPSPAATAVSRKQQLRQRLFPPNNAPEHPPLILEHTTMNAVPVHLENLMNQYQDKRQAPASEFLLLLTYLLALECGFVEEETYQAKRHLLRPVPAFSSFHALNVRCLSEQPVRFELGFNGTFYSIRLRTLLDKHASEAASLVAALQSRLVANTLGDQLIVTLSPGPSSKLPGYSISLSIGRYVLSVQAKNKPLYQRFRKLDELSYQLKQNVFQPMRSQQLMQMKQSLQPSLVGLPGELYDEIFRYLDKTQLGVVSRVNRKLNSYSKDARQKRQKPSRNEES